ncbi:MAG: ribonuclease HII [Patescibacteria group bacterium]
MIKSTFNLEKKLIESGYQIIIGIDEAGRGPLAGPVVACAAALKNHKSRIMNHAIKEFELIRDSKTLSEKQREGLFDFIQEYFFVGIGICDHKTIDRMNILKATFLAMKAALASLNSKIKIQPACRRGRKSKLQFKNQNYLNKECIVLVDGNKVIPNLSVEQRAIVSGDKIVKSISAASVIAKVTRDRIMRKMHDKYPEYGFDKHKGYGTKFHINALKKNGHSKIHRKTFEPVKTLVKRGKR